MKQYDYILFDLDGTITDPALGITNAVMHALEKYNIPVPERSELYKFIGPPLADSFMKYYGMTQPQAMKAIEYYREHFRDIGIFENTVYDGFEELMKRLCDAGKTLIVATSKPEEFAKRITEHFGLAEYCSHVCGSNMDGTRCKKDEVVAYALKTAGVTDVSRAVMVGDREYDITGAAALGLDSIGVLYGYGSREELEAAGATYIAPEVADLFPILVG